jgi:hypothetical protein
VGPTYVDGKTSRAIEWLTVVRQDGAFRPTGGAVQCRFLGQRGAASLMDFRMP